MPIAPTWVSVRFCGSHWFTYDAIALAFAESFVAFTVSGVVIVIVKSSRKFCNQTVVMI